MAQETAVGWLVKIYLQTKKIDFFDIEQAKEKEKEQRKQDLKTGYNQGYIDAQCNHISDADNFTHEYLNH